jgi:hypothetical protein
MPAHPVSRLVRFTLTVGTNVLFDHLGYRRPTVHPVRVIEAVELVACHVGRYLAQLAAHLGACGYGRCVLAPRGTPLRVYAIASGWQRQVRATRVAAMRWKARRRR